jgi:hypothetical protein
MALAWGAFAPVGDRSGKLQMKRILASLVGNALFAAVVVALSSAANATTATWTLNDLSDPMFISLDSGTTSNATVICYNEEACSVQYNDQTTTIAQVIGPSGPLFLTGTYMTPVLESDGSQSDALYTFLDTNTNSFQVYLFSYIESGPQQTCFSDCNGYPTLPPILETGGSQFASQVTWSDGSVDTILFASGVPEPMTLSLLGAGLAGTALLRRRKRQSVLRPRG